MKQLLVDPGPRWAVSHKAIASRGCFTFSPTLERLSNSAERFDSFVGDVLRLITGPADLW